MRIGIFSPEIGGGGVSTLVLTLGPALEKAGHEVTVITGCEGIRAAQLAETQLKHLCLSQKPWESKVGYAHRLAACFTQEDFEILFVNICRSNEPAQLGLHLLSERTIVVPILHNDKVRVYDSALLNAAAWNVAVAVSPKVQQVALARLPQKPVLWIPNGVQIPDAAQSNARCGWEMPLRLLYVGRLEDRQKNIFLLPSILAACQRLSLPVLLTVIGDGSDRLSLRRALAAQHLDSLVELRGFQLTDAVYQAMRQHHILLLPSHFEGMPLVLLEAQANGCVPIASRLPGSTDVCIEDGVTGLFADPNDAQSFAVQIAALADAARWQACSRAGSERVRRFFSLEGMVQRYLDLIEEIRQGAYPLPVPRAVRARCMRHLFTWQDYLPGAIRRWGSIMWRRAKRRLGRFHAGRDGSGVLHSDKG
jgi:glycosyltransferase involved in cell wall biosynthesis